MNASWCGSSTPRGAAPDGLTTFAQRSALGPLQGPIHRQGVLVGKGTPATNGGVVRLRGFKCTSNAPLVQLLLDAGAVLLGKQLPVDASTGSPTIVFTATTTLMTLSARPAAAAGLSGSSASGSVHLTWDDIAGSIRIPAHFCGVCGHKPSQGLLSFAGSAPSGNHWTIEKDPRPARTRYDPVFHQKLQVAGPIARSCEDLALLMEILAKPDPAQLQAGWELKLRRPRISLKRPRGLKIAVWSTDTFCPVESDYSALIERAAMVLNTSMMAVVGMNARPRWKDGESLFEHSHRHYNIVLQAALHAAPELTHEDVEYSQRKRQGLKEAWERFFSEWDVLFSQCRQHQRLCTIIRLVRHHRAWTVIMNDGLEMPQIPTPIKIGGQA